MKFRIALLIILSISINAVAKNKVDETSAEVTKIDYLSTKDPKFKKKKVPNISFSLPSDLTVHTYDGQSLNINNWNNEKSFAAASMIVRWRKGAFNQKEEASYLTMGNGKSEVKVDKKPKDLNVSKAKKLWAIKANYHYENKFSTPVSPPAELKGGRDMLLKPVKGEFEESLLALRCGAWNGLIQYKVRTEENFKANRDSILEILKSFKCQ